jgi:signal transduction histidine kinase
VRLIRSGTPESQVLLVVEDDGLGQGRTASSPPLAVEGRRPDDIEGVGVGVAGMRERLTQLKGRLEFLTAAHGTVVRAYIPCGRPAARRARQLKGSARPSSVALKDDASERAPFDTGQ